MYFFLNSESTLTFGKEGNNMPHFYGVTRKINGKQYCPLF